MSDCKSETRSCIVCNVSNCMYHTSEDTCNAGKIRVGNDDACTSSETRCDTFKMK